MYFDAFCSKLEKPTLNELAKQAEREKKREEARKRREERSKRREEMKKHPRKSMSDTQIVI